MQTLISIIIALIIFSVLVLIHEFGHFIVAKKCGVVVNEFSVGMGPRLLSRVAKSGTRYSIKALPFGGSCAMLGEDEDTKPKAYIGETENFKERVKDHDNKKKFWQKALVFVSKDENIIKADVQYLEYKAIALAKNTNTYVLNENKQMPKAPNMSEPQQDAMDIFFEDVKFLASFVGCNLFDTIEAKEQHLFFISGRKCDAKGFYNSTGFTVLKGSVVAKDTVASLIWKDKRNRLVNEYCSIQDDKLVMNSDKTFSSPSSAADFCTGSSVNGWNVWKDNEGKTLADVYREQI